MAAIALMVAPGMAISQRAFTATDLVMLDRVSDPNLSPDGTTIAYQLRETDFVANKGVTNIWLAGSGMPRAVTSSAVNGSPRWRSDGTMLYFLSTRAEQRAMARGGARLDQ